MDMRKFVSSLTLDEKQELRVALGMDSRYIDTVLNGLELSDDEWRVVEKGALIDGIRLIRERAADALVDARKLLDKFREQRRNEPARLG